MARLTLVALTSVLIAAQQSEEKPAEPKHKTWVEGGFTCIEVKFSHEDKTPNKACFGNFLDMEAEVDHNPFHAEKTCFNWCSLEPCLTLTGNRTQECGACGPAAKCHPAAEDWLKIKPTVKADERCEAYCEGNQCADLKGNPAVECAACKGEYKCKPGSDHFDDYLKRKELARLEQEGRNEL
jgi:hypothetical protein